MVSRLVICSMNLSSILHSPADRLWGSNKSKTGQDAMERTRRHHGCGTG